MYNIVFEGGIIYLKNVVKFEFLFFYFFIFYLLKGSLKVIYGFCHLLKFAAQIEMEAFG